MENRKAESQYIRKENFFDSVTSKGITEELILNGINHCYSVIDVIDNNLKNSNTPSLAELVELANLSSIVGNLVGEGIAKNSKNTLYRNVPHTYPDLLSNDPTNDGIEIKMALETNSPKGHLAKPGHYLTFRYVLTDSKGSYRKGKDSRGDTVTIWEVKFGYLSENDFSISDTEGDSGKTAVIPKPVHNKMTLLYFNPSCVPYVHKYNKPYVGFN